MENKLKIGVYYNTEHNSILALEKIEVYEDLVRTFAIVTLSTEKGSFPKVLLKDIPEFNKRYVRVGAF